MRRGQARNRVVAAALAGGLALNGIAVALLLVGGPRLADRGAGEPSRAIEVILDRRRPPPAPKLSTSAKARASAARDRPAATMTGAATAPRPTADTAAADRPPPAPADDGSIEAARAVLRHLRDCARSSAEDRAGVRCAGGLGAADQTISGVPDAHRAEFQADRRRRDGLLATHGALQQNLMDTRGSAARAGCVYSGGTWRCGSY